MPWKKLGMILKIKDYKGSWLKSHAMLPSPILVNDVIRVYFTGRDEKGHSRISFVDLNKDDPSQILYIHDRPILEVGKLGTFDDSGMLCTCAVNAGERIYLFYNGYNRRVTVPWTNAIGVLVSRDGIHFERIFEGPILDRGPYDPYFVITAWVLLDNKVWHMWYTSGTKWIIINNSPEPLYKIKYSFSYDGFNWIRKNITCIEPRNNYEATARSSVIKEGNKFKMWFCYRGSYDFRDGKDSYRIGYAESDDGIHWKRDDNKAGLNHHDQEWDSKMQAYPAVLKVNNKKYLFYNGNSFGKEGFGCAVWED